jgi:hypothetical protein
MRRSFMLVLALIGGLTLGARQGAATDCGSANGQACSTVATPDPGAAFAWDPSYGRADALVGGNDWIAQSWHSVPFSFSAADTSYTVRSSVSHVTAYAEFERAERLRGNLPPGMRDNRTPLVTPLPNPMFDVWTVVNVDQSAMAFAETRQDVLGADLKLGHRAVIGVVAMRGDGAAGGQGERVAGYFKARMWDSLMVDTRAGWSEGALDLQDSTFSTAHAFVATRLAQSWKLGSYTVAPSVGIAVTSPNSEIDPSNRQSATELSLEQRISRTIALEGQTKIAPYFSYKHVLDSSDAVGIAGDGAASTQSLGAGFTLDSAARYNFSVTTSVERGENQDKPSFDGRVQLKLPLN